MTAPLLLDTPEVPPLGWVIDRNVIEDIWAVYVAPNDHDTGFRSPELRALIALLEAVWTALPADPEPRRYKPTIERTEQ